jgi:hypothetical protein
LRLAAGRARGNSICVLNKGTKGAVAVGAVEVAIRDGGHTWKFLEVGLSILEAEIEINFFFIKLTPYLL